jgi:hypothetical protein
MCGGRLGRSSTGGAAEPGAADGVSGDAGDGDRERIGWDRGLTVLKDRVRELRPVYLPPDPASRTTYAAGELAQCDFWFPPIALPVGVRAGADAEAAAGAGRWRAGTRGGCRQ